MLAAARAARRGGRPLARLSGLPLIVLLAAMLWLSAPLFRSARPATALGAGALIALVAVGFRIVSRVISLGNGIRRLDAWLYRPATHRPRASALDQRRLLPVALLAAGATLLIPNAAALVGGALLLALVSHAIARRQGAIGPAPVLPLLAIALVPAYWLTATIAGNWAPSFAALRDAPFSSAAEIWLVGLFSLGAIGFFGLWPLRGWVPGPVLAPVGGVLMIRTALELLPGGLAHWQPVLALLAVLSIWWGAATRRVPLVLAAAALFGIACLPRDAGAGAMLLCWSASVAAAGPAFPRLSAIDARLRRFGWLVPAAGGLTALEAGLTSEVVYSVLAVAGVTMLMNSGQAPTEGR